uniref:Uncharacterized protein n=1 Tax=Nelumbo nucifera TaxID=4432 RepID=A0A822ZQG8_NELNU|nr:TPA_asm: hypothetical protein HUJ06_017419 [Nelumbo nucifera]
MQRGRMRFHYLGPTSGGIYDATVTCLISGKKRQFTRFPASAGP